MYLAAISASLIAAFQLSGWIQDVSFSILQRPTLENLGHWGPDSRNESIPLLKLPRMGIFKHLADDVNYDMKSVNLLKCQVDEYSLFIEYGTKSFEPTIDICERMAPFLIAYFTEPDVWLIEEDQQFPAILEANLCRFQRVMMFNSKKSKISILSGRAGYSDSYGKGRKGQMWYLGTNRNYGTIMLGTKPFPYAPRSEHDRGPYFTQESFYLPVGKTITFDATIFVPSHSLSQHLNSVTEGTSARIHHWPKICASILKSVDPKLAAVHQVNGTRYFLSRPFVVTSSANVGPSSSFNRLQYWLDFCQAPTTDDASGVDNEMGVPRVHLLDTLGGPQRYWRVDDDHNGDAYSTASSQHHTSLGGYGPNSCEMELVAPPKEGEDAGRGQVRRACGALHSSQSPYSSQSPCDVQRVVNLRTRSGVGEKGSKFGASLLCLEDIISSSFLRPEITPNGEENIGSESSARMPGKQIIYASGRGMADLWARDRAFSDSMSTDRNPFAPVEDVLRAMREHKYEAANANINRRWWHRGSSLRDQIKSDDYKGNPAFSREFRGKKAQVSETGNKNNDTIPFMDKKKVHSAEISDEGSDGVGSDLLSASAGTMADLKLNSNDVISVEALLPLDSLLDGRVEEYKELLRVVHAFGGVHRTYVGAGRASGEGNDPVPPPHLVVRSLLGPLIDFHTTGGTVSRPSSALEVHPAKDVLGAVTLSKSSSDLSGLLKPRPCVLTPRLLDSIQDSLLHMMTLRNAANGTFVPPSKMQWETLVETISLTSRRLSPTGRPASSNAFLYGNIDKPSDGGIGVIEAQGGTSPASSGTPISQPPPSCDSLYIGRGIISDFNRLLLLTTLKQSVLPLFTDGSFICDSRSNSKEISTLYLCAANNIPANRMYPRKYLAQRLRELVTVLSPGGEVYFALDAWRDMEDDVSPLADQLSTDITRQARKLTQMRNSEPTGKLAILEGASSGRYLVAGLLSIADAIEGNGKNPLGHDLHSNSEAKQAKPSINLHLSSADAQIFLFVLPEQFQFAQNLVNRWQRSCGGENTCFIYIKTHIMVVNGEELMEESPRKAGPLDQDHWDAEMSRSAQPSIRASLLLLRDALERGGFPGDLVVALIGLPAALSFPFPGTNSNVLIPSVDYGGNGQYNLSAPIVFSAEVPVPSPTQSHGYTHPGEGSDPRAFAGTGRAIIRMLRELQSSASDMSWYYHHGGDAEVIQSLLQYQHLHPHLVATDTLQIFNKPEGNRRWYWLTDTSHPRGLLQAMKDRAMYLYAPNKDRKNNDYEDVLDLKDYSTAELDDITFNITYCLRVRAMAIEKKEYLPFSQGVEAIEEVAPRQNASIGDEISIGRWLFARLERRKCNTQKSRLQSILWVGDAFPIHPWPPNARYHDRGLRRGVVEDVSAAYVTETYEPVWFREEQLDGLVYSLSQASTMAKYSNTSHEFTEAHANDLPISPFGQGVFILGAKNFAESVGKAAKFVESGMVLATTAFLLQLKRAMSICIDVNRDTYIQDVILLKFAELTKYLHNFRQVVPMESFHLAACNLHSHMSGRGFKHFGFNPYADWDLIRLRERFSQRWPLHRGSVREYLSDSTGHTTDTPTDGLGHEDKKNKNYAALREQYGFSKVGSDGDWGERGGPMASRLMSSTTLVPDMPYFNERCNTDMPEASVSGVPMDCASDQVMRLDFGEGRGPDVGLPIERYLHNHASSEGISEDLGLASMYFSRAFEYRHMKPESGNDDQQNTTDAAKEVFLEMPSGYDNPHHKAILGSLDSNLGPSGVGREALGNIFASATYSALAGVYSVIGPYHAAVGSYAKSIAYADYYTVTARRRRWKIQQSRQQSLLRLQQLAMGEESEQSLAARARLESLAASKNPVSLFKTHFVTMANKINDKLNNLIFTAQSSGIPLAVVGLEEESSQKREKETFDYADKLIAYYSHLSKGLRSGDMQPDDVIVMLDAYDVLLFPAARRIGRLLYESSHAPILFCAESGVYPEAASQYMYPQQQSSGETGLDDTAMIHRYLNSGCIAGRAGQIFRMLQVAYELRDAFKNDQQFYVKYAMTHPDLVALDHSSHIFFTSHKSMNCLSRTVLTNGLSLDYLFMEEIGDGLEQARMERRFSDIGVLHANNLASNRLYNVIGQAFLYATDTHLRGPDGPPLLEAIWALADGNSDRAVEFLLSDAVQRNMSSKGGSNLLGDLLLLRHLDALGPSLVKASAKLRQCDYNEHGTFGAGVSISGLFIDSGAGDKVSVPPSYRALHEQAGLEEEIVQCAYVAHVKFLDSLTAVNTARANIGISPLPKDAHRLICGMPGQTSLSSCRGLRRELGEYAPTDPQSLDDIQVVINREKGMYEWESTGAVFELQQRRLAEILRINVDRCM